MSISCLESLLHFKDKIAQLSIVSVVMVRNVHISNVLI